MASSIGGTPKASAISRADSVTGIKKAPDKSGASSAQYCCRSAAGEEIDDYEKYDHRERADHEHVAHIMPGDGSPRFGRAFNDAVVFHPRSLPGRQRAVVQETTQKHAAMFRRVPDV